LCPRCNAKPDRRCCQIPEMPTTTTTTKKERKKH
jgi:hypothetical protein